MRHLADDGKRIMHAHLKLNGGSLMLNDDFQEYRDGGDARPPSRARRASPELANQTHLVEIGRKHWA